MSCRCTPLDDPAAKALGYETLPVLLGPVPFLKLGKAKEPFFDPLSLLGELPRLRARFWLWLGAGGV